MQVHSIHTHTPKHKHTLSHSHTYMHVFLPSLTTLLIVVMTKISIYGIIHDNMLLYPGIWLFLSPSFSVHNTICAFIKLQVVSTRAWCRDSSSVHDSFQGARQGEDETDLDKKAKSPHCHQHIPLIHVQCKYQHLSNYLVRGCVCGGGGYTGYPTPVGP